MAGDVAASMEVDAAVRSAADRPARLAYHGYGELATKLIDLKGVGRPASFAGQEKERPDF